MRNLLKATPLAVLDKQKADVEELNNQAKGNGAKINYLTIKEGQNKIRVYPAHPETSGAFLVAKCVHYLPLDVQKRNEKGEPVMKDGVPVTERKRIPVYSAIHHSSAKVDPVELYIKNVKQLLEDKHGKNTPEYKAEFGKLSHFKTGILGKLGWAMWADQMTNKEKGYEFGLLEITDGTKQKVDGLMIKSDFEDEMIQTDPFTDPDSGKAFYLKKDSAQEAKNIYTVALDHVKPTPLTDEGIDKFLTMPSLDEMYKNRYHKEDFEKAVQGLQNFDVEHEIGMFEDEHFVEELQAMADLFQPKPTAEKAPVEEAEMPAETPASVTSVTSGKTSRISSVRNQVEG